MSSVSVMTATEAKVLCEQFVEKMRIPTFEGYNHQDASEVLSKLSLIVQNILKQPANEKYRAIPLDNKVILNLLDKYPGAMEYLEILGFQKMQTSKGTQQYVLGMGKENPELLHVGLNVLAENISALQGEAPSSQSKESFNIFQSNILRLSNQMLPTSENLLREKKVEQIVKQREEEVIKAGIPDRELKVFERETSQQVKLEDLPENYARRIDLEILKEVSASVKENKRRSERFQTKAMRDLEMLEKSKVYTKTCICVQFPDDLVVQATFSPLERISDVEDQIRSCMENPENSKFYLFERPQNVRLSSESTLRDLNMVPRARLFVGWEGQAPEGEYIREDLISTPNQKHNVVRETKKQRSIFNFFK